MYFIEPFNFELFSMVILLDISTKLKNAVEYLISLKRSFYSSQFGAKTQVLWKLRFFFFFFFLTISVSRGESLISNTLAPLFLISPFWSVPTTSIPFCCTQCIPPRPFGGWGWIELYMQDLSGWPVDFWTLPSLPQQCDTLALSAFTSWYFLQNLQILRCICSPNSPFLWLAVIKGGHT